MRMASASGESTGQRWRRLIILSSIVSTVDVGIIFVNEETLRRWSYSIKFCRQGTNWPLLQKSIPSIHTGWAAVLRHGTTGWPFRLCQTSRWRQNKSYVLVWGPCTKTQPLFWCQWEVWTNVMCHPVSISQKAFAVIPMLPASGFFPLRGLDHEVGWS